ncbi:hypothetical protein [Streptomyces sp. ISL-100]|uniref:hypothetical protein n=1 Tax=Streptomyces sp. ISL-100 TaxID=2819173 RepID=UPI001BEA38CD|nr:hypothetical protein [Streptomyces sp. ISL-100]MBT2399405.1 hypothetical protein [Streptomyces sp. ISL-100]
MTILEIATFSLRTGVSERAYLEADEAVERTYVSAQPGFRSRNIGSTDDGNRIVVVYWADTASADASMASYMEAPATGDFMALVDADTMVMTRYTMTE